MEHTGKRTDNKSEGIRKASRVVDMSWAADYLDDAWENDHSVKGGYDTQVIPPLARYSDGETAKTSIDPFSITQKFKTSSDEEDDVRIVDAVTDKTIATYEEGQRVISAASRVPDIEEDLKIRDAVTDQTVASVEDARAVRMAAGRYGFSEDLDDLTGLRDAASASRPWKLAPPIFTPFKASPSPFSGSDEPAQEEPSQEDVTEALPRKEREGQTIVASKEAWNVRSAAFLQEQIAKTGKFSLEDLFQEDDGFIEDDEEDYEDYEDYQEEDDLDYEDYDRPDPAYAEPYDDYYEEEREPSRRRREKKRRRGKYYYGYAPARNPLRFIPLVLVIAVCIFGFIAAMQICHDVPLNASDYSKVKYTVEAGLTDEQLSQDLEALGLIDNPLVFRLRCLFYSADYVPGTYELSPCYSTEKMINILSGYTYGSED